MLFRSLDKIKRSQIPKNIKLIREGLKTVKNTVIIPYSAITKQGREEIYTLLDSYLEQESPENGGISEGKI